MNAGFVDLPPLAASIVGHDLRSPASTIISTLETIETLYADDAEFDEIRPLLAGALYAARRQLHLIDEMIDLQKLQSGQYTVERQKLDVVAVISESFASLRFGADFKQIRVIFDLPPVATLFVHADNVLLRRAVAALIDNALMFTTRGDSLWVCARQNGTSAEIRFTDDGHSIEPGLEQALLDGAAVLREQRRRTRTSVGMGLPFIAAVAKAHNGTFSAQSDPKTKMTSFTLTLSVAESEAADE